MDHMVLPQLRIRYLPNVCMDWIRRHSLYMLQSHLVRRRHVSYLPNWSIVRLLLNYFEIWLGSIQQKSRNK